MHTRTQILSFDADHVLPIREQTDGLRVPLEGDPPGLEALEIERSHETQPSPPRVVKARHAVAVSDRDGLELHAQRREPIMKLRT